MSRVIKISKTDQRELLKEFYKSLLALEQSEDVIKFEHKMKHKNEKATIYFTSTAWIKMQALIINFDKEVAWHGLAERYGEEENNEYLISDILIYPQEVTGATVTTDQHAYEDWLVNQPMEVFNKIRMQGHSHVKMGTTPSTTDVIGENQILRQLTDDMFYIFMIWNKDFNNTTKIYDMKKNTLFEKNDISITVLSDEADYIAFLQEAKDKVKEKSYVVANTTTKTESKDDKKKTKSKTTTVTDVDINDMDDEDDDEYFEYCRRYHKEHRSGYGGYGGYGGYYDWY